MSSGQLIVTRRFSTATDMVAHDYGGSHKGWVIATHIWPTGWQELVFSSVAHAECWAAENDLSFSNRLYSKRRKRNEPEARPRL